MTVESLPTEMTGWKTPHTGLFRASGKKCFSDLLTTSHDSFPSCSVSHAFLFLPFVAWKNRGERQLRARLFGAEKERREGSEGGRRRGAHKLKPCKAPGSCCSRRVHHALRWW
jgi:hypothetical protein